MPKQAEFEILVTRRLLADPSASNRSIADQIGVSEAMVRRKRIVLESAGILQPTPIRVGSNGVGQHV